MWLKIFATGLLLVTLAGCRKNPEPAAPAGGARATGPRLSLETVRESERSRNFAAVNRQLELGGAVYGYVDVENDLAKLAGSLRAIVREFAREHEDIAPLAEQDYAALARILGLTDIKAIGLSSVADEAAQFRNRIFVYTGGERHGLMAGLAGRPGPFRHLDLAPADATFFGETDLDVGVLYRTLKDVVAQVGGEPAGSQFELAMKRAGEVVALSLLDLIYGLKGRVAVVARLEANRTVTWSDRPPLVSPGISVLACIDGIAPIVETAMVRTREFQRTDSEGLHLYRPGRPLTFAGERPVIVAEGRTLYVASSLEFFRECRARSGGLARSAAVQRAWNYIGREGNGLTYLSPEFFEHVRRFAKSNPALPAQVKALLAFTMARAPDPTQPLIALRTNLDDGILIRSYSGRSLKQELGGVAVYFPLGMAAALAIPAVHRAQAVSQETAVLNNLRMLAAAADQHYRETGTGVATYDELVGPARYVKSIEPVAGENYRAMRFARGQPLRIRMPNGRSIEYRP